MRPSGAVKLEAWPISIQGANEYVARWHRHHAPVKSALWATSCGVRGEIEPRGVAIVGRPNSRVIQNEGRRAPGQFTTKAEVVRVATDGTPNACSFLYSRCSRLAQVFGYEGLKSYILKTESGASLRGVAAIEEADVRGREHDTPSRRRNLKGGAQSENKTRWELLAPPDTGEKQ